LKLVLGKNGTRIESLLSFAVVVSFDNFKCFLRVEKERFQIDVFARAHFVPLLGEKTPVAFHAQKLKKECTMPTNKAKKQVLLFNQISFQMNFPQTFFRFLTHRVFLLCISLLVSIFLEGFSESHCMMNVLSPRAISLKLDVDTSPIAHALQYATFHVSDMLGTSTVIWICMQHQRWSETPLANSAIGLAVGAITSIGLSYIRSQLLRVNPPRRNTPPEGQSEVSEVTRDEPPGRDPVLVDRPEGPDSEHPGVAAVQGERVQFARNGEPGLRGTFPEQTSLVHDPATLIRGPTEHSLRTSLDLTAPITTIRHEVHFHGKMNESIGSSGTTPGAISGTISGTTTDASVSLRELLSTQEIKKKLELFLTSYISPERTSRLKTINAEDTTISELDTSASDSSQELVNALISTLVS